MTTSTLERGATPISTRQLWLTLIVVLIADALDLMDATITNVAAPTIAADLGGGEALVKWLGAAYALALGSLLVLGGRIGDRFGQRRTFLIGLSGFVLASAFAGLALSPEMLIAARAMQGAFGAFLIPQGMAIMTRTFPRAALQKAFGAFGPMLGIFAVGGPLLGGVLIDADILGLGWRPMFLINIVVGGIALVLAWRVLPHVDPDPTVRFDLLSSILLPLAMFALLFGLIEGSSDGWSLTAYGSITIAAILFAAFIRRQMTSDRPLLPRALFAGRGFVSGLVAGLLVFAAFNGLMYVVSLYFQLGMGYTPTQTSLGLLPFTLGIIAGSAASMGLIARLGRRLVLVGLLITMLGSATLLFVGLTTGLQAPWWQLAIATTIIGIGAGTCFGTIFDTALGGVQPELAGAASGSFSAVQQLAAGIGSATVTSVFFGAFDDGAVPALTSTLLVVLGITAVCLLAVPFLPRKAAVLEH